MGKFIKLTLHATHLDKKTISFNVDRIVALTPYQNGDGTIVHTDYTENDIYMAHVKESIDEIIELGEKHEIADEFEEKFRRHALEMSVLFQQRRKEIIF